MENIQKKSVKLVYFFSRVFWPGFFKIIWPAVQVNEIMDDLEHNQINWELLSEPEAVQLILRLAQFDENLAESYRKLEPSVLVKYLFRLCHDTSRAVKVLRVKGAEKEVAVPRYVLFQVSQKVLHFGMTILGLKPLEEM